MLCGGITPPSIKAIFKAFRSYFASKCLVYDVNRPMKQNYFPSKQPGIHNASQLTVCVNYISLIFNCVSIRRSNQPTFVL